MHDAKMFRTKVKAIIGSKDWTQAELAKHVPTTPAMLSQWLSGAVTPDTESLRKLARALGVELSYLLGDDNAVTVATIVSPPQPHERKGLPRMHKLPVLGKAAANYNPAAVGPSADFEDVDVKYSKKNHYIIMAKGRSMYPTFSEGDRLIVESAQLRLDEYDQDRGPADKQKWLALNEEVVIAIVDDGMQEIVKRFFCFQDRKKGFRIYLQSDNRRVPPIPIESDMTLTIIGIVRDIMRDPKNYE